MFSRVYARILNRVCLVETIQDGREDMLTQNAFIQRIEQRGVRLGKESSHD